jgi:hypothetical protein
MLITLAVDSCFLTFVSHHYEAPPPLEVSDDGASEC